jgi:ferredoxin-nitrate reductase
MDRQLDPLGSQLLHEELEDKGIEIFYNDEIGRVAGEEAVTGIHLKSGLYLECSAIVVAIGTVPNIELAKSAGLHCKRGVVVNEYLQTSDPNVFAIGEIAEFNGFLYGITAAAEEQGAVIASYYMVIFLSITKDLY